jgi:hypothetical protein
MLNMYKQLKKKKSKQLSLNEVVGNQRKGDFCVLPRQDPKIML